MDVVLKSCVMLKIKEKHRLSFVVNLSENLFVWALGEIHRHWNTLLYSLHYQTFLLHNGKHKYKDGGVGDNEGA